MEGLDLKANVKWAKFCILTWNCRMLARRHLLAATSSTRMMWMDDARALWRAAMSVSENARCYCQSLNRQNKQESLAEHMVRSLECCVTQLTAHTEDLVGHGKCQLGKVKDGVIVAKKKKKKREQKLFSSTGVSILWKAKLVVLKVALKYVWQCVCWLYP